VSVENDVLAAKALGLKGMFYQRYVNFFFQRLNNQKVIAQPDGARAFTLYNPPMPSKAGMRALDARVKERFFGVTTPTTATLAVTNKCQCDCVHCSAAFFEKYKKGRREVSTAVVKEVIDGALDLGIINIVFTGGEPSLRKDLEALIRHVDKDRAQAMMFTNGVSLTEEKVAKLRDAGLYALYVSLDSPEEHEHDRFRKMTGCYHAALQGAARSRRAGILTGLSTYATSESILNGKLEKTIHLAKKEGFHEVTIFDCMPAGNFFKKTDQLLSREEKDRIIGMAKKYAGKSDYPGVIAQSLINSPMGTGCFGGFYQFYMTPYGEITPCDFNPISFGNVNETPIKDIWAKMTSHPEYARRAMNCRVQCGEYRKKYLDPLQDPSRLPVPIEHFEKEDNDNE
jgi:MoaA/NifB/PqqE/SkfB family radical SAM enzyme